MMSTKFFNYLLLLTSSLFIVPSYLSADELSPNKDGAHKTKLLWMNTALSSDNRAELLLSQMSQSEKLQLVFGYFATDLDWKKYQRPEASLPFSAGFIPGISRLGVPAQYQTDAGIGVATQPGWTTPRGRTALPAGIVTASSWNKNIAFEGGKMIGSEARSSGFNVMLAGGVNLQREPRNGRNFEYAGEDPLLAGTIVGQQIKGIQSNNIVSTLKHFAFNNQETGRGKLSANISDANARMSDLLAFQIALEIGQPGSVMCAYNRVNSFYSCESDYLLNQVLKKDWGFKGYVMSDWGAVHSTTQAANNGLDQQSGHPFDEATYFSGPLKEAVEQGWVPQARLDNMAFRILRSFVDVGVMDNPVISESKIDFDTHANITQATAEEGITLLKNKNNLLPLDKNTQKIAIIGSHADVGVLAGGGSSAVYPVEGNAVSGLSPSGWPGPVIYFPSSPLLAIQKQFPNAKVIYNDGLDVAKAKTLAESVDVVIVFASQWVAESIDAKDLTLPSNQDKLIADIAKVNTNTIVVLETGTPVLMPWLSKVSGVIEAWYPGSRGGNAIARVIAGEVNPSGHLPVTFPASEAQLPRVVVDGDLKNDQLRFDVNYFEGAAVGYKWFDLKGYKPLFPFGFGLSYTQFVFSGLSAGMENGQLIIHCNASNIGERKGKSVPQVYVSPTANIKWESHKRLAGWDKVELFPGETKAIKFNVDPRLLAIFESDTKRWFIAEGNYKVILATDAGSEVEALNVHLKQSYLDVNGIQIN
jgi:beta-glucosidase